nr:hypothetical protein Itr_chr06CG16160 [Ipomoea trifida]
MEFEVSSGDDDGGEGVGGDDRSSGGGGYGFKAEAGAVVAILKATAAAEVAVTATEAEEVPSAVGRMGLLLVTAQTAMAKLFTQQPISHFFPLF